MSRCKPHDVWPINILPVYQLDPDLSTNLRTSGPATWLACMRPSPVEREAVAWRAWGYRLACMRPSPGVHEVVTWWAWGRTSPGVHEVARRLASMRPYIAWRAWGRRLACMRPLPGGRQAIRCRTCDVTCHVRLPLLYFAINFAPKLPTEPHRRCNSSVKMNSTIGQKWNFYLRLARKVPRSRQVS